MSSPALYQGTLLPWKMYEFKYYNPIVDKFIFEHPSQIIEIQNDAKLSVNGESREFVVSNSGGNHIILHDFMMLAAA